MKVTYTTGGNAAIKVAELHLENIGVNRFRASIPVQDEAGTVMSRTAEIEAASERTKNGTVRVMLKCTIPYVPQMVDEGGHVVFDSSKSPKNYTLHIVHTIPAVMANEALNGALARQVAQVIGIATAIINLGTINSSLNLGTDNIMYNAPLQTGSLSVDGVQAFPLTDAHLDSEGGFVYQAHNIAGSVLAGSFVGRALAGLMPIDINNNKEQQLATTLQVQA